MSRALATLLINEQRSGLRVLFACGFLGRLIGFWPSPRWHTMDVIEFPQCRAVHTFAMVASVDVVFVDGAGRVLRLVPRVSPWRMVRHPKASAVFEFRAGVSLALGIETGTSLRSCSTMTDENR